MHGGELQWVFYCKKPALVIYKGLLNIRYPDLSKKFI